MAVEKVFPLMMIGLSVAASLAYFYKGATPHGVYWIAAATLTTTTLFMN